MLGLTMAGPPSLKETVGRLAEHLPEVLPQRFAQVGVDLRRSDAGMSEQDLDNTDVDAPLKQVRREAVPERVRPELVFEAALASRFVESVPGRGIR